MAHNAVRGEPFECNLGPNTRLPMMYLPDCTAATVGMLKAPANKLRLRTYNVTAMSFTPEEFAAEIRHHYPDFKVTYKPVPHIQAIGKSSGVCISFMQRKQRSIKKELQRKQTSIGFVLTRM